MLKSMHKSKNRYFYHIFVSPGDAPGAITLNVVWMEREFDAYKLSRSMYPSPSIFNSFPVIRTAIAKIAVFTYRSPHFCFPWRRRCDYHAMCCMDGKSQDRAYAYASRGNKTYILNFANHRVATPFNWYKRRVKNRILACFFYYLGCPCTIIFDDGIYTNTFNFQTGVLIYHERYNTNTSFYLWFKNLNVTYIYNVEIYTRMFTLLL